MTDLVVRFNEVFKQYGSKTILHNIDLQIKEGEFIALVGESGGGKSTILRLLAQLEQPTGGEIFYADPQLVKRVMFQNDRLLPWLPIIENITFKNKSAIAKAQQLLDSVGLRQYDKAFPSQLSGGQKQRVALARALMASPQLLLLDEPLGALDALTRRQMQELILKICRQQHLTTVLVTHDVEEAVRMADRILVIKDGRISREFFGMAGGSSEEIAHSAEKVLAAILGKEQEFAS